MIQSAGDLGVTIDYGNNEPGAVLQRLENGDWQDCLVDGKPATAPIDIETLPAGNYRLWVHKTTQLLPTQKRTKHPDHYLPRGFLA
jgi:hypothetical protein